VQATPNVHVLRVRSEAYAGAYSPNVYVVTDRGRAVLVDSGLPDESSARGSIDYVAGLGCRVELIALTHHHFDHAGGAPMLAEAFDSPVGMDVKEERLLSEARKRRPEALGERTLTVERRLADRDIIDVGSLRLRAVETPGHSAGHLCFFLEEQRVLFSGDNVLGLGTTAIPPPPWGDMGQYVRSLERMQALEATLLCPGHGPLVHQPQEKIAELIEHRRERQEQVLSLLREGETTVDGLLRGIYPELAPRLVGMAKGQILAHLCKLRDEGRVVQVTDTVWQVVS